MSKLDFDDARTDELKEFMCLWNKLTMEIQMSSHNDKIRVREVALVFLKRYAHNKDLKTSLKDRKELWLGHLLNLYTASLLSSKELIELKLQMDLKY